jgi:hypothetical protein
VPTLPLLTKHCCHPHCIYIPVPQCLSPRWNWDSPIPSKQRRGNTLARGWGRPNSDDMRKSLALCLVSTLCCHPTAAPRPPADLHHTPANSHHPCILFELLSCWAPLCPLSKSTNLLSSSLLLLLHHRSSSALVVNWPDLPAPSNCRRHYESIWYGTVGYRSGKIPVRYETDVDKLPDCHNDLLYVKIQCSGSVKISPDPQNIEINGAVLVKYLVKIWIYGQEKNKSTNFF